MLAVCTDEHLDLGVNIPVATDLWATGKIKGLGCAKWCLPTMCSVILLRYTRTLQFHTQFLENVRQKANSKQAHTNQSETSHYGCWTESKPEKVIMSLHFSMWSIKKYSSHCNKTVKAATLWNDGCTKSSTSKLWNKNLILHMVSGICG